jgi:hypothetical protein
MTPETNAFDQPEHDPNAPDQVGGGVNLAAFDQEYEQAEAPNFDEVPDGKYQVRIEAVRMAESQKHDPMIKWDLIVISGQFEGRHIFKNSVVTQASLPFVKGDLKTLGVQLPKFSDLPNHLEGLLDKRLQVTKKTKDEFTNVYFNKLLAIPEGGGLQGAPAPF